jgi:hypothetical protein
MKKIILGTATSILLSYASHAQLAAKNLETPFLTSTSQAKAGLTDQFKNLKLYYIVAKPSLAKEIGEIGNYINLERAMQLGIVEVTEVNNGGTVNELLFRNKSKDTVMLNMGDVVKGGKQDRVVEKDMLLLPLTKTVVPVYCVEHGRWSGNENPRSGTATFNGYHSTISSKVRESIVKDKSQQQVWAKVADINSSYSTTTNTGTYTAVTNSENYKKELARYTAALKGDILKNEKIVGLVAVSGDKIIGCDIYATRELFKSNLQNLLQSYITEAISDGSPVTIADSYVANYLDQLLSDEQKQEVMLNGNGRSLKLKGKNLKLTAFDNGKNR